MRACSIAAIAWLSWANVLGCGSDESAADTLTGSESQSETSLAHDTESGGADTTTGSASDEEADTTASFAGVWRKRETGDAMVLSNDCGDFWVLGFDYEYTRHEVVGETLVISYCLDSECQQTEAITDELTIEGAIAEAGTPSTYEGDGCTIGIESVSRFELLSPTTGRFRWDNALSYEGAGCDAYKDEATTDDSCVAVAEVAVDKIVEGP